MAQVHLLNLFHFVHLFTAEAENDYECFENFVTCDCAVTPVICTAMIDTTIAICAHLIVIMMTYASECVEPLLPFQTISQSILTMGNSTF